MFHKFTLICALLLLFAPAISNGASFEELLKQIAELQAQIATLQKQLTDIKQTGPIPSGLTFLKNLNITDQNEEVKELQKILKSESLFCSRCLITGYFGYWTKAGLMNFQQKYKLKITGSVNEETRAKLNELAQKTRSTTPQPAPVATSPTPPPAALNPPPFSPAPSPQDTSSPSFTINIDDGRASTNNQDVLIQVSCKDPSGGEAVRFSNFPTFMNEPWGGAGAGIRWRLSSGDGLKTVYAQCQDAKGNIANASDSISLDALAPISSAISPTGTLAAGTTQVTLSFTTNEAATCRYTEIPGVDYDAMREADTFSGANSTSHSIVVSTVSPGSYSFYVRCKDAMGNKNFFDSRVTFVIVSPPLPPPPPPAPTSMPILVLKYFPLEIGTQNLDSAITGMSDSLTSIRSKVDSLTQQGIDKMEIGSTYHGYKDGSTTKALDYFVLATKEYLSPLPVSNNQIPWNPSAFRPDYMKMLNDSNVCDYVNNRGVKQVWVWGYHFGNIEPAESNMAMGTASSAFWNHGTYGDVSNSEQINDMPTCSKTYTLYNYNYGRGLGELLEDHGHQLESVYSFADNNLWSKFKDPYGEPSPVVNSCGWTHSGPNSKAEYQPGWASETIVKSNCEDWHPDGSGAVKDVSCHTWYGAVCLDNTGVEFKTWWMQNIPGKDNNLVDGIKKLRNWWDFYGDFDSALQQGKNLSS